MQNNLSIGRLGEEIAVEYLKNKGFQIIERNFRRPWGELDIIARDKSGTLIFIEVKTLKCKDILDTTLQITPEDNMSRAKISKTKKIAAMYANGHLELVDEVRGWRVDLIAIRLEISRKTDSFGVKEYLTSGSKHCEIKYFENVE